MIVPAPSNRDGATATTPSARLRWVRCPARSRSRSPSSPPPTSADAYCPRCQCPTRRHSRIGLLSGGAPTDLSADKPAVAVRAFRPRSTPERFGCSCVGSQSSNVRRLDQQLTDNQGEAKGWASQPQVQFQRRDGDLGNPLGGGPSRPIVNPRPSDHQRGGPVILGGRGPERLDGGRGPECLDCPSPLRIG
jgi:hypothetical protein